MKVDALSTAAGTLHAMDNPPNPGRLRTDAPRRWGRGLAAAAGVAFAVTAQSDPAAADLRLCNNTSSRVGISVGYKENEGWTTEGWWNLNARSCETLLRGVLVARFYY